MIQVFVFFLSTEEQLIEIVITLGEELPNFLSKSDYGNKGIVKL